MNSVQKILNRKAFVITAAVLTAVLLLCWYALNHRPAENTLKSNQKIIHEYISKNLETQKTISASMQMVTDLYLKKAEYPVDKIKSQHETLKSCKNTIETDSELLQPLKKIYAEEYDVVESLLGFAESNYGSTLTKEDIDYVNSLGAKEKEICVRKNNAYIELFKGASLKYTVSSDGTINYEYAE